MHSEFAPAKVNLFLHVAAPGADGRHQLCSLVVFADVGDRVQAERASQMSLRVDGPFGEQIGPVDDNLIVRALRLAKAEPMRVHLSKHLPAAAGLGGGTSDAGAALRLARQMDPGLSLNQVEAAARSLGADGLMCLQARACLAEGEGERLSAAPDMPILPAVLVNPAVPSPTGAVYRAYDAGGGAFSADRPALPNRFSSVAEVADFLAAQRNDLQEPAVRLVPRVRDALAAVRQQPGALLSRMSGSGATVFGLFEDDEAAQAAATEIAGAHPTWWVQPCRLNAGHPGDEVD